MSTSNQIHPQGRAEVAADALVRVIPALYSVARSMITNRFPQLKGFPQLRILLRLAAAPDLSLKDLAEREGVTPPTMSKSVDTLVEKGWATRTASAGDRRSVHIAVTPAGAALAHEVGVDLRRQFAALLGRWDDRSLSVLVEALGLLESGVLRG